MSANAAMSSKLLSISGRLMFRMAPLRKTF
jgi:hypothetical protein